MMSSYQFCTFLILSLICQAEEKWTLDWTVGKVVTMSRCISDDSKCFSNRIDGSYSSKNPCKFPFKDSNTTYNSCTRSNSNPPGFWCATSVNNDLEWQTFGFCNDFCQLEGMYLYFCFKTC